MCITNILIWLSFKHGKMMAFGDHKAILGQVNGDGRIKVYMSYQMDYDEFDKFKG